MFYCHACHKHPWIPQYQLTRVSLVVKSINFLRGWPPTAQQSDRKASADPRSGPVLEEEEEAGAGGGSIRGCAA